MTIYEDLTTLLGGVASGNFYLQVLPQEYQLPCVLLRVIEKEPISNLCGATGEYKYLILFECWGDDFAPVVTLETEVRSLLNADTSLLKWEEATTGEEFEPIAEGFMLPVYFGFYYEE